MEFAQQMLTSLWGPIEGLAHALRETQQLRRDRRIRFQRALAFNRDCTFVDTRTALWMCPTCNRVHTALHRSAIDGPVYPACCAHERGGRKEKRYATGLA